MAKAPADATRCCVPFCRRWSRKFKGEWMCGDHWRLLPRDRRKVWSRGCKRFVAARARGQECEGFISFAGREAHVEYQHAWRALDRIWDRLKHQATELAL